jgi:hypothetical protein
MARSREKWGFWLWIFAGEREMTGVYWSVIGHRLRVGAKGKKGKVQEWCSLVWIGVEMWEMGLPEGRGGLMMGVHFGGRAEIKHRFP